MPSLLWPESPCLFTSNFGVAAVTLEGHDCPKLSTGT